MAWYINKGKNAVPTNRGWENSVTGEVYISHRGLKDKMIAAGHLCLLYTSPSPRD